MAKKLQIIKMRLDRGNLGSRYMWVMEVTEKVIKTCSNECYVTYYRRVDGSRKTSERGMSMIGDGHISNLEGLEKFIKENGKEKNGVYVWNGGFKLRVNSRGEEVNPSCYKLQGYKTYEEWFASMNVEIVNLVK